MGGGDRSGETWDDDDLGEGVSGGVSLEVDSLAVPRLPISTARGGEERRGGGVDRRRQIKVSKQLLHLDKVRPGTGTDGRCQADGTTDFFFARCGMEVMDIGNCQGGPSRGRSHWDSSLGILSWLELQSASVSGALALFLPPSWRRSCYATRRLLAQQAGTTADTLRNCLLARHTAAESGISRNERQWHPASAPNPQPASLDSEVGRFEPRQGLGRDWAGTGQGTNGLLTASGHTSDRGLPRALQKNSSSPHADFPNCPRTAPESGMPGPMPKSHNPLGPTALLCRPHPARTGHAPQFVLSPSRTPSSSRCLPPSDEGILQVPRHPPLFLHDMDPTQTPAHHCCSVVNVGERDDGFVRRRRSTRIVCAH